MELFSPSESLALHRDAASRSSPSASRAEDPAPHGHDLGERLEALEVLASALAALAARRRSDDELGRLEEALRAMSEAADSAAFASGARAFESVIVDAADNTLLASGLALLQRGEDADARLAALIENATGTGAGSLLAGYASLADAVARGDAGRASRSAGEVVERLRTAALRAPCAPVNQSSASRRTAQRRGDRP